MKIGKVILFLFFIISNEAYLSYDICKNVGISEVGTGMKLQILS